MVIYYVVKHDFHILHSKTCAETRQLCSIYEGIQHAHTYFTTLTQATGL